jgi:hypothetical protein
MQGSVRSSCSGFKSSATAAAGSIKNITCREPQEEEKLIAVTERTFMQREESSSYTTASVYTYIDIVLHGVEQHQM